MTAPFTPGGYLKRRRQAAMLSVADVAAMVATEPRTAEHLRGEWLELIEADVSPMTLTTIVALRRVFPFDLQALWMLEQIAQGAPIASPRLCRVCACSELDACPGVDGYGCSWEDEDLCSSCHTQGEDVVATRLEMPA